MEHTQKINDRREGPVQNHVKIRQYENKNSLEYDILMEEEEEEKQQQQQPIKKHRRGEFTASSPAHRLIKFYCNGPEWACVRVSPPGRRAGQCGDLLLELLT